MRSFLHGHQWRFLEREREGRRGRERETEREVNKWTRETLGFGIRLPVTLNIKKKLKNLLE